MNNGGTWIRVWDPLIRIGHWLLVLAFFVAYFTEDDLLTVHAWAGYLVGGIVCVRILWGFVGSRHARFTDFVRGPRAILKYISGLLSGNARRYIGHNPAGGAMVIALLLMLLTTVYSGLAVYALEERRGPLANLIVDHYPVSDGDAMEQLEDREDFWEEVHEVAANLTLLLVAIHVLGVALSSRAHKENLVRAMVTGRKRPHTRRYSEASDGNVAGSYSKIRDQERPTRPAEE